LRTVISRCTKYDLKMQRIRSLTERQKDLLAILALFVLSAAFFARVLFTDEVLVGDTLARYIPWNYYVESEGQEPINYEFDTLLAYYPQILVAKQTLESGQLPLWNPYYLSGLPLMAAAPWLGLFYPPYVLFYLVDILKAFGYVSCLQLGLAATFMYLYLRNLDCRRLAALAGGASFGLGGFMLGNLTWLPRVSTVMWLPLIFLAVDKLMKKNWAYALLLACATALCILAGNLAAVIYVLLASCLYAGFRLVLAWRREGSRMAVRCGVAIAVALSVGVLLSAIQLIPTFEVSAYAGRVQASYEERLESGRSPLALATALVPDVYGNPVDRPWGRNVFAKNVPGTYGETSLYVGIAPLLLGLWAVWRRRDVLSAFYAGLGLLGLLIFLDTPLFRVLYHLPLFRIGRQLEAKTLWAMAAAVLAALGLNALLRGLSSQEGRMLRRAGVGIVVAAVAIAVGAALTRVLLPGGAWPQLSELAMEWCEYNVTNFLRLSLLLLACGIVALLWARGGARPSILGVLVLFIVFADLAYFGWRLNPSHHPQDLYPEMESVRFLQGDDSLYRVIRGPLSRKVFPPNSLTVYGISDVQGYSPVLINYYVEFMQAIEEEIASARMVYSLRYPVSTTSPLVDLLNAKYVVTIAEPGEEMTTLARGEPGLEMVYDDEVKIFENEDVLPRAFFVSAYTVAADGGEALDLLRAEGFDPASEVILEKEPAPLTGAGESGLAESQVEVAEYTPNRVVIDVFAPRDGFLVLSDLHYAGWRVTVDGAEKEVYKGDYAFRAVQLEAGQHQVQFVFDPLSFKIGLAVSLFALLALAAMAGLWWAGRRRDCPAGPREPNPTVAEVGAG
jgi:hypothetical protein